MKNIDMKSAALGAALLFVGYKKMTGNSTANTAVIALGAVVLAKQLPVVGSMV